MRIAFMIPVFSMIVASSSWAGEYKQQAYSAIQEFFQAELVDHTLTLEGRYIDTPAEYGENCKILIDFSAPGKETFTLIGDYTPASSVGDGIYFDEADETFKRVIVNHDDAKKSLEITQKIADSSSTWMKTTVQIVRSAGKVDVLLHKTTRFLFFFSDTVTNRCVARLPS